MEERTGCKIQVKGKGSQRDGMSNPAEESEQQYVIISGDSQEQVAYGRAEVEKILYADEETRKKIKGEQLRLLAQ